MDLALGGVIAAAALVAWPLPVAAGASTVAALGLLHSARHAEQRFARRR